MVQFISPQEVSGRLDAVQWPTFYETYSTTGAAPLEITYRFGTNRPDDIWDSSWTDVSGWGSYSDAEKAAIRRALDEYSRYLNITFVESDAAENTFDMEFLRASEGVSGGRGRFQYTTRPVLDFDGFILFNTNRDLSRASDMTLILHEIGHAFTLKHPGNYDINPLNAPPGPYLPEAEDNYQFTLMSYHDNPNLPQGPDQLMLYDIAALQERWGANLTTATGDDSYGVRPDGNLSVIWDAGGTDQITAAGSQGDAEIDLREGGFSRFALSGADAELRLAVAYGSQIENALGGQGDDLIEGNDLANQLEGGAGNDTLQGRAGDDTLRGGDGGDVLRGDNGRDLLEGDAGNDTLDGGLWDDTLRGGDGDDSLYGNAGADSLHGGNDNDTLNGFWGDDTLAGEAGDDLLFGYSGNDLLQGGAGDDTLQAGSGLDTLMGGDGEDVASFLAEDLPERSFDGLNLTDLRAITTAGDALILTSDSQQTTVSGVESFVFLDGSYSAADLRARAATPLQLTGTEAADVLIGDAGNDRLDGGGGDDTLEAGDGSDTLIGGSGNDSLMGGDSNADLRDVIYAGAGDDHLDGGYGNDELRGDGGQDTLLGGFGADQLIGGADDDVLSGQAWSDLIFGGDGMDFINGGFGSDRVNGGSGGDRFYHLGLRDHGSDWVQDYSASDGDRLVYGGSDASRDDFMVQTATTANAGSDSTAESFVVYRPTGQILWALVDGDGQSAIQLQLNGAVFDLLG